MPQDIIDYASERNEDEVNWRDVIECPYETLWDKCRAVLEASVKLPLSELQVPLILSLILTPSAMSTRLPIAFFYGGSGSGKSMAGIFASKMYGETTVQESSTTASIRNELNSRKWVTHPKDPEIKLEKNTILVWDDLRPIRINPSSPDNIFGILKSGCSRQTSVTKTALPGGNTIEFCTFGTKIISSIHPIWSVPGAEELQRRAMIFKFVKTDASHLLNLENVSIFDLEIELKSYWLKKTVLRLYSQIKKQVAAIKSKVDNNFKIMCHDVLATCVIMSGTSVEDSIKLLDEYMVNVRLPLLEASIVDELLDQFIREQKADFEAANLSFQKEGLPEFCRDEFVIHSSDVLRFFKQRIADGSIDLPKADNSIIHLLMQRKDFKPTITKNGVYWSKQV